MRPIQSYRAPALEELYNFGPHVGTLTFEITDEKGNPRQFGSVAGGGRYDDLVKRFTGQSVPATGVSIGVDRLLAEVRQRLPRSAPLFPEDMLTDCSERFLCSEIIREKVFRRTGEPCPRCRRIITRLLVGQRSTHICEVCQK